MAELQAFQQLVVNLLGTDNKTRDLAEKQYNELPLQNRAQFLLQLYMDATVNAEVRSMSLVLFRRLLSADYNELIHAIGEAGKQEFFQKFIDFITQEQAPILRKRLTDIVAEISRNTINEDSGKQEWTGVMQLIEHCATSDRPELREVGMQLIENVPNIFGVDQEQYMNGIKTMFQSSLLYGADSKVRTAAVKAYVSFVCENDENDVVVKTLADLIPAVLQVCQHVVTTEDDDDVPLQCLGDLASAVPKILTPHLTTIAELCLQTMGNTEKDENYRHSALEVMVSYCEAAPATMRKKGARFLPLLVQNCLKLMTDLEEDISDWLACDNIDEDEDEENVGIGEMALDRICCAVGGKAVMQPLLQAINEIIKHEDWRYRHAAIMGLSTMGEGCRRQMEPLISQIIHDMVIPCIQDPHPRVRYAVCNCLGQMSTDFSPTVQKKCHERVLGALIENVGDLTTPRVAAHAGAALVNFCEECPKSIMGVYLKSIMDKLESVLAETFQKMVESGKKLVLEQIITTIAAVADAAENNFAEYYPRLSHSLKYILSNSNSREFKALRGKTMECLSLIGIAVGRENFRADAAEIMNTLLQSGLTFDEEDDPELSYMISSWARLCKVLGAEFAPYLPHVMPSIMKSASMQPNVNIISDDEVGGYDEDDWNIISLGDQRSIGVKTAGLEDKLTACEMLVSFARDLGAAFGPYIEEVLNLMVSELKYVFHDGVRIAAAECLPALLACVKEQGVDTERAVFNRIFEPLIKSLENESDLEVLASKLYAVAQMIEETGTRLFGENELKIVLGVVQNQMKRYEERQVEIKKSRKDDDFDEEDQQELEAIYDSEASVLARIADVVHYSFAAFGEKMLPYFAELNQQFAVLLDSSRPWRDRQWGTCIYDDIIEYGGDQGRLQYQQVYLPNLLRHAGDDDYPEVRQAAAYGIGVLAMKGGPQFAPFCAEAVTVMAHAINLPNARESEEGLAATENAISAVAKILKHNSSALDTNTVIPAFISWLPIWQDDEELPYVYDYFCDLVEGQHSAVIGANNENVPKMFQIILSTFSHGAFETDEPAKELIQTKERLANILKALRQNETLFQQIVSSIQISPQQHKILEVILA
ncbi:unnamed protein product [Bursaphelenchus okinawaensis]|uniref:IPO4/5-like TPR repeats domain-containing protein n=1 Tax=Bursaphelenchus okinawaensis TaxID=465554 RepID=A0A811LI23_9BILA|nr:unnamed protein product [Bursaphelenchus okinawaensis]CAG9124185.1 unnamed protein product [Bursaphelenchus okinawaensis]